MDRIKNISQYRNRLDKTLAAHELTNVEALEKLVRVQLLRTLESKLEENIDHIAEKRTKEVFDCVQMLKSTADYDTADQSRNTDQRGWKLKQDTEENRVMYREGPEGTPFHSLLVEGYVDGPLDVCLCIAWESNLYRKWWPQSTIPTFKILSSECLQKVRIGEQICLVRCKLSWPLSTREAIVHFFEFEYFQDDLIVVLFNSISDMQSTDGFLKDLIPDKKDVIRIDVLGGMAIQKVSATRSYFRTIANVDIKLEFVPPSVINFISRQLIGSGFLLYKKEVASVSRGDNDFKKALEDPLHCRIREAIYSNNTQQTHLQSETANDTSSENEVDRGSKTVSEIEEVKVEEIGELEDNENASHDLALDNVYKEEEIFCSKKSRSKMHVSPQVKHALETLDKTISFLREYRNSDSSIVRLPSSLRKREVEKPKDLEECLKDGNSSEVSKEISMEKISHELRISFGSRSSRRIGSNPYTREANHSKKIVPTSPEVNNRNPNDSEHISLSDAFSFHKTGVESSLILEKNNKVDDRQHTSAIGNGTHIVTKSKAKRKKLRKFCCLHIGAERF